MCDCKPCGSLDLSVLVEILSGVDSDHVTGPRRIGSVGWLVGFVALRPKSTAMVIAGRSVHLTTLFPGQA